MRLTDSYPTKDAQTRLIEFAAQQIQNAMQDTSVAVRHNAFTDYCLALLFCCTGHRPVIDPIHSRKLFDLDHGWMLIADKVVHEERSWRLVSLPPIACQQIQHYLDYLPRLAAWLDQNPQTLRLRKQVEELLSGTESIPFFFYLDENTPGKVLSITPSIMAKRWEQHWCLPINFLRHMTATELRRYSGQAYWAQIQLGHFSGSEHPFGVTAAQSAQKILADISTHLEQFMQDMGWQALTSPVRLPQRATAPEIEYNGQLKSNPFGDSPRKQQRQKKRTIIKSYIRNALDNALQGQSALSSPDQIKQAANHIIIHTPTSLTNPCLRMLYRYVARLPAGKALLKQSAPARVFNIEPSPFNENSLLLYRHTAQFRHNFLQYLDESYQPGLTVDPTIRVAEIVMSAALFGGIADSAKLGKIAAALHGSTYQYKQKLFLDIPLTDEPDSPVFRWFPDTISHMLIQGYFQHANTPAVSKQKLNSTLTKLLKAIEIDAQNDALEQIAKAANAAVIIEAPGHTAKFLSGELVSVSIPLQQWVRIHSGQALAVKSAQAAIDTVLVQAPISIGQSSTIKDARGQGKLLLKLLRNIFNNAHNALSSGNTSINTVRKRELVHLIKNQFSSSQASWSPLALSLAAWTIYLCENGTRAKKNLAFSTIDKYVFMIARALLQIDLQEHFLALDTDAYESLYLNILEVAPENRQHDIAGRLLEFHRFLVSAYAVDEPSWSVIFRAVNQGENSSFADANFVSEDEYLAMLEAINTSPHLHPRTRSQYITLLILGYRFGLRFGEAYRLQYRDIQQDKEAIYLCIRNNIFGEVKSASGQRIVPLLEKLTDLERTTLDQLISWAAIHWQTDQQAALMAESQNTRVLINRTTTASEINQFIKLITGDNSLRFHHLRHSWATRMYAYHYENGTDAGSSSLASTSIIPERWAEFIGNHATHYPLTSIATAIGHLSESTTIEHYVHAIDVSYQQPDSLAPLLVSSRASAYAVSISHANARQRAARRTLLNISRNIQQPEVKSKARPISVDIANINTLETKLSLSNVEQLLSRLRDTKQSTEQVATQLFIEPSIAKEIITIATRAERQSGVDYYQLEHADNPSLLLTDAQRQQLAEQQANPKSFIAQNRNIQSVLEDCSELIDEMSDAELKKLSDAFITWRQTLKTDINIVSDKQEIADIQYIRDTLFNELKITFNSSENENENAVKSNNSSEKTAARKLSGTSIKINTNNRINTKLMLNRILLLISIYLEYKI